MNWKNMDLKNIINFTRHGKIGRNLSNVPIIKVCGNNVMGLMGFARIYKIPYISTIGFDMDKSGSWKKIRQWKWGIIDTKTIISRLFRL